MNEVHGGLRWIEIASDLLVQHGAYSYGSALVDASMDFTGVITGADHQMPLGPVVEDIKESLFEGAEGYSLKAEMAALHPKGLLDMWLLLKDDLEASFVVLTELDKGMGVKATRPPVLGRLREMTLEETRSWRKVQMAHLRVKAMVRMLMEFSRRWESNVRSNAVLAWSEPMLVDQMAAGRPDTPESICDRKPVEWWATLQVMFIREVYGMKPASVGKQKFGGEALSSSVQEGSMPTLLSDTSASESPNSGQQLLQRSREDLLATEDLPCPHNEKMDLAHRAMSTMASIHDLE
jgi:hypothetical protein